MMALLPILCFLHFVEIEKPTLPSETFTYDVYVKYMKTVARLGLYGKSKTTFYRAREGLYDRKDVVKEGMFKTKQNTLFAHAL